jgi:putative ABC transport system permease protein
MARMYAKLAFRNMRRSMRDYGIYFATLVVGVCMFYAFNSITQQGAVLQLSDAADRTLELLSMMIGGVSVFLAVVLGFLVVYANRFLVRRRSKEFAIYLTLGMRRGQVMRIVALETLLVGLVSLLVGLAIGYLLSQVLLVVTAAMFSVKMDTFTFFFSFDATKITVICFLVMFAVSFAFNVVSISRCRLIDLLNSDRKNEQVTLRSLPLSAILLVVSIGCIGVAYWLLRQTGLTDIDPQFIASTVLVCLGTFLFFYSLSGVVLHLAQRNRSGYLKGLRMFTLRQLGNRVNTAWVSVSLVSLVLFLALTSACGGFAIVSAFNASIESATVYDASYTIFYGHGNKENPTVDSVKQESAADDGRMDKAFARDVPGWGDLVSKDAQIDWYEGDSITKDMVDPLVSLLPEGVSTDNIEGTPFDVIPLSELNATRALSGLAPVTLGDDEYLVWCDFEDMKAFWKAFEGNNGNLSLFGATLHPSAVGLDGTITETAAMPMNMGAIVVPDKVIPSDAYIRRSALSIMYNGSRDAVDSRFTSAIDEAYGSLLADDSQELSWPVNNGYTAVEMRAQSVGLTAVVTYLAIYIGVILLITCAAILALQQLTDAADNVSRYTLIEKLGADQKMVYHALYEQIGVYFIVPLVLALCHSVCAMSVVADTVKLLGNMDILMPLATTALLAVAVYGGYYAITCMMSKNMIRPRR